MKQVRRIVTVLVMLAGAVLCMAPAQPEVRTKGEVAAGYPVVFWDASGRWISANTNLNIALMTTNITAGTGITVTQVSSQDVVIAVNTNVIGSQAWVDGKFETIAKVTVISNLVDVLEGQTNSYLTEAEAGVQYQPTGTYATVTAMGVVSAEVAVASSDVDTLQGMTNSYLTAETDTLNSVVQRGHTVTNAGDFILLGDQPDNGFRDAALRVLVGSHYGIFATTTGDYAIYGIASGDMGVYGKASDDYGVRGYATDDRGVYGESGDDYGVYGYANGSFGVYGFSPIGGFGGYFKSARTGLYVTVTGPGPVAYFDGAIALSGGVSIAKSDIDNWNAAETDPIYAASSNLWLRIATAGTQYQPTGTYATVAALGVVSAELAVASSDVDQLQAATNAFLTAETDPLAVLATGARAMSGNLDMGGNSVTNVATNSFAFAGGMKIGADNDNLLFQSTNAAAGLLPVAKQSAVTAEASTRSAADTTHTADISALDTRVDRNEANILQNFLMDSLNHETDYIPMQDAKLDTYNTSTPGMWWVNAATSSGYVFTASEFAPLPSVAGTDLSDMKVHVKANDSNATTVITDDGTEANKTLLTTTPGFSPTTEEQSVTGKIGSGFAQNDSFDTVGFEVFSVADYMKASSPTGFTYAFWIKINDEGHPSPTEYISGTMNLDLSDRFAILNYSVGKVMWYMNVNGSNQRAYLDTPIFLAGVGANDWVHLVFVYDPDDTSQEMHIYTNGYEAELHVSAAYNGDITVSLSGFDPGIMLGMGTRLWAESGPFDGDGNIGYQSYWSDYYYDDFRFFGRALSDAEIVAIWNNGGGTESSSPGSFAGTEMYVQSSNQLYSTSADETYSWVYMAGSDTNVVTNIQYRTSLDGGATWLNNILEPSGIITAGTFTNSIFFAETNFPASGTNLMYEFNTINDDGGGVIRDVAIGRK